MPAVQGELPVRGASVRVSGELIAVFTGLSCRSRTPVKMRKQIPERIVASCLCGSKFVCPIGDAEEGTVPLVCLDCLKMESLPMS